MAKRHSKNSGDEIAETAPIANPGEIEFYAEEHKGKTEIRGRGRHGEGPLFRMWFGQVGTTHLYVWADSLESAFEESVEWLDDNAPGHLTEVTVAELKDAAEDLKIEWDPSWPDYEDRKFQKVVESAEADLTQIGHTSLKHGQYVVSYEWGGDDVTPGSAEWNEVVCRSWAEGVPEIEVDYESVGPNQDEPEGALHVQMSGSNVEITEWTDIEAAGGEPGESGEEVSRQDATVSIARLLDPEAPHRASYSGDNDKPTCDDVLRMAPAAREKAVVAAAISYIAYGAGVSESLVGYLGE